MQAQYKMVDDKTGRYLPFIYPEELPFWEGTKNRQLKLQRCSDCHKAWYPIGSTCPHCFSSKWEWALMSGRGVLQWILNGNPTDRFEGELWHGKQTGEGVMVYGDGRRYEGSFRDSQRTGRGTLTYPNGTKYVGDWKADRPHGKGTLTAGTPRVVDVAGAAVDVGVRDAPGDAEAGGL